MSIYLFICLSIYLFVYLSIYLYLNSLISDTDIAVVKNIFIVSFNKYIVSSLIDRNKHG